jgi:enamine deaminase RidA (YjgF/YER057c/UK114 family)
MTIEERIADLGLSLPVAARPIGAYKARLAAGPFLFLSGQLPIVEGKMQHPGRLGAEVTLENGKLAARIAALNVLAQIREELGSFDRLVKLVRVDGFVASVPEFTESPKVLDGASDFFAKVLGEKAGHCRLAVGMSVGPANACLELGVIAEIR